ncbi:MAG: hypothetical protein ACTSPS_13885 [Promethearchaeota archaeon]
MCNSCDCENIDQCSIVGFQPKTACCSLCASWDEAHTCDIYHAMLAECTEPEIVELIPQKIVKKVKGKAQEISLDQFP